MPAGTGSEFFMPLLVNHTPNRRRYRHVSVFLYRHMTVPSVRSLR